MRKANKDTVLRARADQALKQDVQWAASYERLDEADIIRKACAWYVGRLKSQPQNLQHAA